MNLETDIFYKPLAVHFYRYFDVLPTEFFWTFCFFHLLGGSPTLWLGIYSYASLISDERSRATTLSRMDSSLFIGNFLGVFGAPILFKLFSYYGTYGLGLLTSYFAFIYLYFVIKYSSTILNFLEH